jgi:FtsP/CotA-like multicopper oxidase with cupredoxin domain
VVVKQWAYGLSGQPASVPGPELRVQQGNLVRITLNNTHHQPHTIHLHGVTSLAMEMDGVPHTSHHVLPGESYTYEFVATEAGTHAYHCHVQTFLHMDMGMYGALVIEPRDGQRVWTKDITLVLDEWDSRQDPDALVHVSEPDHFLVNGKAYPNIEPVRIDEGEVARLRFVNMGYEPHSLHLHGMGFLVVAKDGYDLAVPYRGDTLPILPGERYDILVQGRDGDFPFHDHIVSNVTNRGVYPGGMHFMVLGGPARDAHGGLGHGHGEHAHGAEYEADWSDLPVHQGAATVRIVDFGFEAPVIRVTAGTTVTWINETRASHSVTHGFPGSLPADRLFDSSGQGTGRVRLLRSGESWSYTFDQPGTYSYYCLPHTWMTGTVVVE